MFFITAFPLLQCYRDLALVSRDGMNIVLNKINQILMEKYLKLQDTCRTQVRGAADLAETRRGHWSWRGGVVGSPGGDVLRGLWGGGGIASTVLSWEGPPNPPSLLLLPS